MLASGLISVLGSRLNISVNVNDLDPMIKVRGDDIVMGQC